MKKIFLSFVLLSLIAWASYLYYQKNNSGYYERVLDIEIIRGGKKVTPRLQDFMDDGKIAKSCITLSQGIEHSNFALIKYALEGGVDPNCKQSRDSLPVCMKTLLKDTTDLALMNYVASNGCDYSYENEEGENAFHIMSSSLNYRTLALYIDKLVRLGVDINHQNIFGDTPLMYSINNSGNAKHTEIFIKYGADLNYKNMDRSTALGIAITNDNSKVIDLLKSKGAQSYINGEAVNNALQLKVQNKRKQEFLEKQKKRQASWSKYMDYWTNFINAHNLDLSCSFRLMGGPRNGPQGITLNEQMNNTLSMPTGMDAFVFGGCPDWKYYHYLIIGKSGRIYSQDSNLIWYEPNSPIGSETSSFIVLPFDDEFQGSIQWYGSHKKVNNLKVEKASLELLKEYSLYVYK